ncbi:MAG: hypothetical protein WBW32_19300, partial [Luteibacter sp.]
MIAAVYVYLLLLLGAVVFFVLHLVAQWRFSSLLKQRYPDHWKTITEADTGRPNGMANWLRMRRVLR